MSSLTARSAWSSARRSHGDGPGERPCGRTESCACISASVPSEHRMASVWVKREHIVAVHHRSFHTWRSRWHSGNSDADDARRVLQQALHVRGRNMSLYHVTVDECGMTGGSGPRHTVRALQPPDFRTRCVNRDDTEGVGAQVRHPSSAATARRRFVYGDGRSARRRIPAALQHHCVSGQICFRRAAGRDGDGGQCKARNDSGSDRRKFHRLFPVNGSARKAARTASDAFHTSAACENAIASSPRTCESSSE